MTPTPERALELAEWAEDAASYIDTEDEIGHSLHEAEEEKLSYMQLAKIARHYAEILPKWQAVLDAEPFAEIDEDGDLSIAGSWCGNVGAVAVNAKLIIKPAP